MPGRLNVGLIGVGRLGRLYGRYLAQRVPNARLVAVASGRGDSAREFAAEYGVPRWYAGYQDLLGDREVEAVAVVSSSSTHHDVVIDAARAGKAIFCEKPLSLSLEAALEMLDVVKGTGTFFQISFQRRFDAGYLAARRKVEEGVIGTPVMMISTSRDTSRPPVEFCDPVVSGGMIMDMGGHDFDAVRMFMGEVRRVYATGGTLAYPELKPVGDIDNAVINLVFESGALGSVHLSRNGIFGYDIRGEVWGTKGSLQIGYYRQTPLLVLTQAGVTHDAVPYFMERFEPAYMAQIQDFVNQVLAGGKPSVTGADALAALRICLAANQSLRENRPIEISETQTDVAKTNG
jgi:inositol 2-dehydrogenase